MISTQSIASYIESKLNDNELEVVFSVTGDYGKYSKLKSNVEEWVTPAICRALSGNFEPIAGVVAYSTSLAVEFFTFASAIAASKGAPRYENTKKVIEDTVQALNGVPIFIDGLLCIFQSGTVTEGAVTQQGGGYERLPLLMNFFLTVTNVVEIANNYPLKIDGNEIIYSNMTINAQKVGDSGATVGNAVMKTRYNSTAVSLSADLYLLPSDFRDKYLDDILGKTDKTRDVNTEYDIEYMGREYKMSLQNGSIVAQMGALIVVRMAFSPCGFVTYTVSFNADGGTGNSPQSGEYGDNITLPSTTKTHYDFLGWYLDDVRVGGAGDNYIIGGNTTLTARWRTATYTVTFDGNGGDTPPAQSAEYGTQITLPSTSYGSIAFLGWHNGLDKVGDAGGSYTVLGNITLTAWWDNRTSNRIIRIARTDSWKIISTYPVTSNLIVNCYTYDVALGEYVNWDLTIPIRSITSETIQNSVRTFENIVSISPAEDATYTYFFL